MSQAIVECVPNFSEGRDPAVIDKIVERIRQTPHAHLLDIKPGQADHRTVVTFVGSPEAVCEAAFAAIAEAQRLIDMRHHSGEHPRMGATDVCPLVPLKGISLEECAKYAHKLGERVGNELGIPVFLYEAAASTPSRTRLPDLRKGEYEALAAKLESPEWGPDFGPKSWTESVARSGGTVIGARPLLIAWNINLNTLNQRKAEKIASRIREKGYNLYDAQGKRLLDAAGNQKKAPGLFKQVNAIGWTIEEYGRCQISINLTNFRITPMHHVYDAVRRLAIEEGVVVTGSELVGLVPKDALLEAGHHYLRLAGENPGRPENDVIHYAINSLGLNDLEPFDPAKSIIENLVFPDGPLVQQTVHGFSNLLSSSAPAPGGGSTAALCGALSAALSAMVAQLSTRITKKSWPYGQPRPTDWQEFDNTAVLAQQLQNEFLADVDADTAAFDAIMTARRLPKASPEQQQVRKAAMRAAILNAIETPLRSLKRCLRALDCAAVAAQGNPNARSDAGVAISCARTCAEGTWMNVQINLSSLRSIEERKQYADQADEVLAQVQARAQQLLQSIMQELSHNG